MRKLNQIVNDMKTRLLTEFTTVRISSVQLSEQMLAELRAINAEKLPAVLIVWENSGLENGNTVLSHRFQLVLISKFYASSDDRATKLFESAEDLLELFPIEGVTVSNVRYDASNLTACSADPGYACIALEITARPE